VTLRAVQTRFFKAFARVHTPLMARTRGWPSHIGNNKRFLVLVTRGLRSGQARKVVLLYMPDPGGYVVIASNFGGERPPAWWANLRAGPGAEVHVSGKARAVRARLLEGPEREAVVARAVRYNAQWRRYFSVVERELPVVLLEPAPG